MRVQTLSVSGRQRLHARHGVLPTVSLKKSEGHAGHECGSVALLLCSTSKLVLHKHCEIWCALFEIEFSGHCCWLSSVPSQKKLSAQGTHCVPARMKVGLHLHASCRVKPLVHSCEGQACCFPTTQK
jgi:hypothetical protein